MKRYFMEHPATVGESYGEHMGQALSFAWHMIAGGAACLIHAFLPFLFQRTGSGRVAMLYDRMVINRRRRAIATAEEVPATAG